MLDENYILNGTLVGIVIGIIMQLFDIFTYLDHLCALIIIFKLFAIDPIKRFLIYYNFTYLRYLINIIFILSWINFIPNILLSELFQKKK